MMTNISSNSQVDSKLTARQLNHLAKKTPLKSVVVKTNDGEFVCPAKYVDKILKVTSSVVPVVDVSHTHTH